MDSSVRDSKVSPIGDLEGAEDELRMGRVGREGYEEESVLVPGGGGGKEEVKPTTKRKVQWNDTNGNKLAEIMEFLPSDVSDSEDEESDSCFCTIM